MLYIICLYAQYIILDFLPSSTKSVANKNNTDVICCSCFLCEICFTGLQIYNGIRTAIEAGTNRNRVTAMSKRLDSKYRVKLLTHTGLYPPVVHSPPDDFWTFLASNGATVPIGAIGVNWHQFAAEHLEQHPLSDHPSSDHVSFAAQHPLSDHISLASTTNHNSPANGILTNLHSGKKSVSTILLRHCYGLVQNIGISGVGCQIECI